LIAYFLSNVTAKYYENPTMLSPVIAKTGTLKARVKERACNGLGG